MVTRAKLLLYSATIASLLAAGAGGTWYVQEYRWQAKYSQAETLHSNTLAELARAGARQLQAEQAKRIQLEQERELIDQHHFKEYTDVTATNAQLVVDLAAARQRLSVRVNHPARSDSLPTTSSAAGVDDEELRADIHPADAARIAAITGEADECAVTLGALQEWVRVERSVRSAAQP